MKIPALILGPLLARLTRGLFGSRPPSRSRLRGFRPGAGCFEQLERREVFNATYHGGLLLDEVEVQAVYLGAKWKQEPYKVESDQLNEFLDYLVKSPYMDMLTEAGYGVGQGTALPGALIDVDLSAFPTVSDLQLRDVLQQAIDLSFVQQPTPERLFVIYVQPGTGVRSGGVTSQTTLTGYHGALAGEDKWNTPFDIHYVVVPHPGGPNATSLANGYRGMGVPEEQTLTVTATAAGSLALSLDGMAATTALTWTGATGAPNAAQVQASLETIPALDDNVVVTGSAGSYTITVFNLGDINDLQVSQVSGGLTAAVTNVTDGTEGISSNFDQLTSVTSRELVNAVTNPNNNFKTRGWFDDARNVEIATLGAPVAQLASVHSRLGPNQYFVQHVRDQGGEIIGPDTTSDPLDTAPKIIAIDQTSLTRAKITWSPVVGATGYRILLVNGDRTTPLARVPNEQTTTELRNLPPGVTLHLRVEAYNAGNVSAPGATSDDIFYAVPLPPLTPPGQAGRVILSATSVQLRWTNDGSAAGYRIYIVNGTKKRIIATADETATSHTISGLMPGTTVTFRIEAYRKGQAVLSRLITVKLPPLFLTAPQVTATVVEGSPNTVKLQWKPVPEAQGFRIYRVQGTRRVLLTSLPASTTTHTISGAPVGSRFIVQAYRGAKVANSRLVP